MADPTTPSGTPPQLTLSVRVTGRVQGVWYRGWTAAEATRLGLSGWVRNEADGSVLALLHGPGDRVRAMVALMRDGPPAARVDRVETAAGAAPDAFGFRVIR
ncbi:acylphosphatase [Palleronia sp. KMU-117]|uniref:acylphosphatase n=1 Tax=Palleronia sp. KMU-117 TaxID=3434108 RepID=UPI003D74D001